MATPYKTSASAIWEAVAAGANTSDLVALKCGISRGHASIFLRVMVDVGLLKARYEPMEVQANPHRSGRQFIYSVDRDAALKMGW